MLVAVIDYLLHQDETNPCQRITALLKLASYRLTMQEYCPRAIYDSRRGAVSGHTVWGWDINRFAHGLRAAAKRVPVIELLTNADPRVGVCKPEHYADFMQCSLERWVEQGCSYVTGEPDAGDAGAYVAFEAGARVFVNGGADMKNLNLLYICREKLFRNEHSDAKKLHLIKSLLRLRADPSFSGTQDGYRGHTVLHEAVAARVSIPVLEEWISAGANPNAVWHQYRSLPTVAGTPHVMERNVDRRDLPDYRTITPLMLAAGWFSLGHSTPFPIPIPKPPAPRLRRMDEDGRIIRLLLEKRADPKIAPRGGLTPLHECVRSQHRPEVIDALINSGADPQAVFRVNAFSQNGRRFVEYPIREYTALATDGRVTPADLDPEHRYPILHAPQTSETSLQR